MGITKWGDTPLSEFQIGKIKEDLNGYNYFLYVHSLGFKVVMRENRDGSGCDYAVYDGDWGNKENLEYGDWDRLA